MFSLKRISSLVIALGVLSLTACSNNQQPQVAQKSIKKQTVPVVYEKRTAPPVKRITQPIEPFANQLSNAALSRLNSRVRYDGSYIKIGYPWGDVPQNIGVCTDVVIRSYRKLGIDLQEQVHRDMSAAFYAYPNPKKWGLSKPDTNIDHRRVYNMRAFLARRGAALPITRNPTDYRPGDLVTWMVGPDLPHIGIVVNKRSKADPRRFMIVHNIAEGPQIEDILFRFRITGHYRYTLKHMRNIPEASTYYAKRNDQSRTDAMNYAELVRAADILNVNPTR